MKETVLHYTRTAKALHWGMALIVIGLLASGLLMEDIAMPLKFEVIQMHKSFGLLVLLLVFARVMWRFTNPAPMLPAAAPLWQKAVAHSTHGLLYVLMFGMPLVGWLMSDAKGYHPTLFGLPVPVLLSDVNKELGHTLEEIHEVGGFVMIGLLVLHVGAALYHHIVLKDDILKRMLPARCKKGESCCCGH